MTKTILIYEPSHRGHHLYYVRLIVTAVESRGWKSVLATSASAESSIEFEDALGDLDMSVTFLPDGDSYALAAIEAVRKARLADAVVVPNADVLLTRLALRMPVRLPVPYIALVMRDPFAVLASTPRERLKLLLKKRLLQRAQRIERLRVLRLGPANPTSAAPDLLADPVNVQFVPNDAKVGLDRLTADRYWIAMVGVIGEWKNPVLSIRALAEADVRHVAGLAIFGVVEESVANDVQNALRELPDGLPVIRESRPLTNDEFNAVVARSDAVLMAYSTHAPNSTAAKAAALGTRVIAAGSATYQRNVVAIAPEAITTKLTPQALADGIREAVGLPRPHVVTAFPDAEQFGQVFTSAIECMLDRP